MLCGLTLAIAGAAPAAAQGRPRDPVPDDQPLPGYTINNPPLAPLVVDGRPARVLQGTTGHAAYIIEVPARWNGQLVMWAHGFVGETRVLSPEPPAFGLRQKLVSQGYAWASSSYYANDYDVKAGVLSTRHLADRFAHLVGKPKKRFIVGVSMGGHITGRSIEEYPGYYDAAMPMCGVMGDHGLFDFFLDFQVVAQDLADLPAYPVPADYQTVVVPKIQAALGLTGLTPTGPDTTNALGKQFRSIVINRSGGPRPGDTAAFANWYRFLFGLATPRVPDGTLAQEPEQVATNLRTRYVPDKPVNVNKTVQRVRPAEPGLRATRRLTENPSISGRLSVPVLSLHNLGDLFVPFSMEQLYRDDVARHGRTGLLVQRAIRAAGHCEFSPKEAGDAWDDLVRWERYGVRPPGDDVKTRGVVADPAYGCRFTDPAVRNTGTRPLYPACP